MDQRVVLGSLKKSDSNIHLLVQPPPDFYYFKTPSKGAKQQLVYDV
jgi:hypothetical protein